jgi:PAS domain S-box-containing protein
MMKKENPEIIKTLREEERLGKLRSHSSEEEPHEGAEEPEEDPYDSIFTILRHRTEDSIKTVDLGDPSEKYRIIFENSAVAIMLTDENERIVHWNKYTEDLLGLGRDELMMKPVKSLYPTEEWNKIRSENIRQKGIHYHLETKMIQKNNKLVDVDISLSVLKDNIGNVIGSIGIVKDNTKSKQMERALKSSEEKFKQLYEKAPVPYHTLSPNGLITNVNEKWCKLFGYSKEEVLGKSIFDFIHGEEQTTAESSFKEKTHSKNPYTGGHERTYLTKNGEPHVFVINDFLSYDDTGAVISVHTTMEDITERKKTEEELRKAHYWLEKRVEERTIELLKSNTLLKKKINEHKRTVGELHIALERLQKSQDRIEQQNIRLKKLDKIKSNFLNITSHELRTPIAAIKGYVEMLLMNTLGPINEEQKRGIEVALRNANRLDNLIQDILDVSRLESGTMKFIPEKTNIHKMIKDATETTQSSADNKQIKITTEIEQGIPELIVDQERIKQVLTNLLNNAIKFSPEKTQITIRAKKEHDDVLFEVQDFGRGIPKNKQKKIFEIFYQVDSGMDRKFGGVGLGLAISRGIVLSHGGTIWVESEASKGSTFRFTLPIKPIQDLEGKFKEVDIFRL